MNNPITPQKEEKGLVTIEANKNAFFEILEKDKEKIHVLLSKEPRDPLTNQAKAGNINFIHSFCIEEFSRLQHAGAFGEAGFSSMEFLHDPRP